MNKTFIGGTKLHEPIKITLPSWCYMTLFRDYFRLFDVNPVVEPL